ncbi:unnamed protein product [Bemisia tabaci]|uniref:Uncharacterized protein n=1 Tax=Bemisia tabaci TaxID=7038 RepID=A0A9P0A7I3_BEMTA|nr:unnamed protein product [Bemisia tabaci]
MLAEGESSAYVSAGGTVSSTVSGEEHPPPESSPSGSPLKKKKKVCRRRDPVYQPRLVLRDSPGIVGLRTRFKKQSIQDEEKAVISEIMSRFRHVEKQKDLEEQQKQQLHASAPPKSPQKSPPKSPQQSPPKTPPKKDRNDVRMMTDASLTLHRCLRDMLYDPETLQVKQAAVAGKIVQATDSYNALILMGVNAHSAPIVHFFPLNAHISRNDVRMMTDASLTLHRCLRDMLYDPETLQVKQAAVAGKIVQATDSYNALILIGVNAHSAPILSRQFT